MSEDAAPEVLSPRGVITKRSIGKPLALLSVTVTVVGYVIGVLAAPHGHFWVQPRGASTGEFDWSNAMLGATAAGTVLLAAFTAAFAYTTSGDVSATWRLAQRASGMSTLRAGLTRHAQSASLLQL